MKKPTHPDLETCPCCGHSAGFWYDHKSFNNVVLIYAWCSKCGLESVKIQVGKWESNYFELIYKAERKIARRWNRRTAYEPQDHAG